MRARWALGIAALAIAGCGGGGEDKGLPGTDDPQVKQVAQAYVDAYTAKDEQRICELVTPKVRRQLADNKGTCEKTIRFSLGMSEEFPQLTIGEAKADGDTGRAIVEGQKRQITLERVGSDWMVVNGGT